MDKQLRDTIKHDKFREEVLHTVDYYRDHKAAVRKYGGVVAGAVVLVAVVYGFFSWRQSQRREDLRQATLVLDGFVGDNPPPGTRHLFKTQAEKDQTAGKAFSEVAVKYSGSLEGQVARYLSATSLCDQGKTVECEAALRDAMNGSDSGVASVAKLSLATLYQSQGKLGEAEALARQLVEKPTPMVSKEQGQIALAKSILRSKPQEAKILLEALQAVDRPPVTRAAVGLLGELMGVQMPQMPQR